MTTPHFRGPFVLGDRVQLTDAKGRKVTMTLTEDGGFHSHRGVLLHSDIVGLPEGSVISNSFGIEYLALRPLLADFAMSMPRGAAIVYPKDAGQIVAFADIYPGARVVEAGVGSGALSMSLLRAVGSDGELISFERREEFAEIAAGNIAAQFGGAPENHRIVLGDLAEELPRVVEPGSIDRVVLDMLAPWECLDAVTDALAPGGVLVCYIATVTQMSRVVEALRARGDYADAQCSETLVRTWHVEGLAVRPDHRMIAHTGFLTISRRLAPGAVLPVPQRKNKPEFAVEDIEAWTPGSVGDRTPSDKRLRKAARSATELAQQTLRETS